MKLYHVTRKYNLKSIKEKGLSLDYFLKESNYSGNHSGDAIYLSKFIQGNNLTIELNNLLNTGNLISLEIDLSKLDHEKIYPDDGIYWAFENEVIFHDEDLESVQKAFFLDSTDDAKNKLNILEELTHNELIKEFKKIWYWYLVNEGEISYKKNIPFKDISQIIEI